jgi:hypothetical protein
MSRQEDDILVELNLLENALDFISKGIDELFDEEYRLFPVDPPERPIGNYKYGVLDLYSGFLLLIKERLVQHHSESIFIGSMADVRAKLSKGRTPNTVNLDEALERLDLGPRVVFSDKDLACIRSIQRFRNAFEHHQVRVNPYQLWAELSRFLQIIDQFLVDHLGIRLEERVEHEALYDKIQNIERVWQRIVEKQEAEWRHDMQRRLHEFQSSREEILASLEFNYCRSKGAEAPFMDCPECRQETLIESGDYRGICIECGNFFYVTTCEICGMPMAKGSRYPGEVDWCDICRARVESE